MKQIEFRLSLGTAGPPLWRVRSPQIPGLLVSERSITGALEETARAIHDMALACEMERAAGREVGPMFRNVG